MNPYTSERLLLERHNAIVREAEVRARLLPGSDRSPGIKSWVAVRLRGLADRLDGRAAFERAAQ